jgi:hypothetical protein
MERVAGASGRQLLGVANYRSLHLRVVWIRNLQHIPGYPPLPNGEDGFSCGAHKRVKSNNRLNLSDMSSRAETTVLLL